MVNKRRTVVGRRNNWFVVCTGVFLAIDKALGHILSSDDSHLIGTACLPACSANECIQTQIHSEIVS